jgi:bifunctional DNA-binding transcriptional regulator/antitoxin component of YhaV-PrlF toxin-antitoxin module
MTNVSVDRQGRLVLPLGVRRRLGLEGRAGQLRLVETPDGVLLEAPPAKVTVVTGADGLPAVTIEGLTGTVENEAVLQAIEAERSGR